MNVPEVNPKVKENGGPGTAADPGDRLSRIVEAKRREVEGLRASADELLDKARLAGPTRPFAEALRSPIDVRLLAEIKNRSPSAGTIRAGADPVEVAEAYEAGGAAALSVLTDEEFFGGSLDALRRVRGAVDLPLLRKDFIIDPLQVWEARGAGADAILLIVRILTDQELRSLHELANSLGMDVLVEVHDRFELHRALGQRATLIGINNRDLRTFETDLSLSLELARVVKSKITLVSESGIRTPDDVRTLGAAGIDAVLVGESLMRQDDLTAAARTLWGLRKDSGIRDNS